MTPQDAALNQTYRRGRNLEALGEIDCRRRISNNSNGVFRERGMVMGFTMRNASFVLSIPNVVERGS